MMMMMMMMYAAMACTWIGSIMQEMLMVFHTSVVIDGVCYGYVVMSLDAKLGINVYYFLFTYCFLLFVFAFCYGKILVVIRRQARVMAGHNHGGSAK